MDAVTRGARSRDPGFVQGEKDRPGATPSACLTRLPGPYRGSIQPATAMLDRLLMYKLPAEAEAVPRAAVLADEGYRVFRDAARVGRADYELVAEVEAFFRVARRRRQFPDHRRRRRGGARHGAARGAAHRARRPGDDRTDALRRWLLRADLPDAGRRRADIEAQRRAFCVYREAIEAGVAAVRRGRRWLTLRAPRTTCSAATAWAIT